MSSSEVFMKYFKIILSLMAIVSLATGCGPEKSTLDIDRDLEEQRESQKTAENSQVAGRYLGQALYKDQPIINIDLEIRSLESIGATGEASPVLRGFLKAVFTSAFTGNSDNNKPFDIVFSAIDFDGRGSLVMEGTPSDVPSVAKEKATINLTVNGNRMDGWFYPPRPIEINGERVFYLKVQFEKQ